MERLRPLAAGVAWIAADNLHVTLKFLGGVEPPKVELVQSAVARAVRGTAPFDLVVTGLGAFPSATRPRVIWAGITAGRGELTGLAASIEHELAPIGFAPEDRPFSPHVTLGRVRETRRNERLAEAFETGTAERFGTIRVEHVSLMRSDLSPRGARYSELSAHLLG
ncbi:MAG: RNA 2',3'-cyclic phosphodiesterase [Candidatus Rokubacteria bacterium]|nr:RNA 2',3'-cyclic phosphodiesterase [Candidatus Rokubacteria bacterium]